MAYGMSHRTSATTAAILLALTAGVLLLPGATGMALAESRIKDIARFEGVRDNDLIGYGLVVGLKGTGDSGSAMFTVQSVANMLLQFGIKVSPDQMRVKNVAAVMVTATLPAFSRVGDRLDVVVSSLGDAKGLEGGTLLMTPLQGPDGRFYAAAQGELSTTAGGGGGSASGRSRTHPTVARIPQGAIVEEQIAASLGTGSDGALVLVLARPDFVTADRVARAVCARLGDGAARAVDAGAVRVQVPPEYAGDLVKLVALVEEIPVTADAPARVVFNERTGTVVIGGSARVLPAAISHGSLTVRIAGGETEQSDGAAGTVFSVPQADTVDALVAALNSVGAGPRDIIAVLQALRACGALLAEIEIM